MVGAHVDVERLVAMQQGQVHQAAAVQRVGVAEGVAQPGSHGGLGVAVGAQVDVARLELGIRVQPLVRRTVRLAEAQAERPVSRAACSSARSRAWVSTSPVKRS